MLLRINMHPIFRVRIRLLRGKKKDNKIFAHHVFAVNYVRLPSISPIKQDNISIKGYTFDSVLIFWFSQQSFLIASWSASRVNKSVLLLSDVYL